MGLHLGSSAKVNYLLAEPRHNITWLKQANSWWMLDLWLPDALPEIGQS